MKKRFELIAEVDDDDVMTTKVYNDGFNGLELLGILDLKKTDIIDQSFHPEKFKFVRTALQDGTIVQKIREDEEEPNGHDD